MRLRKWCVLVPVLAALGPRVPAAAPRASPAPPPAEDAPAGEASSETAPAGPPAPAKAAPRDPEYEAKYLYSLSTSFGPLPLSAVQLSYDRAHHELFVTGDGPVRVFNESGMETFTFGDDAELGFVLSIASTEEGDLIALARQGAHPVIARCSFRGEFRSIIEPQGVPSAARLAPDVLRYAGGKLYLANLSEMRVLVLDASGGYLAYYDIAQKLGEAARRADLGLRGFNVDGEGNILFTIQPLFHAYTMTPEGDLREFGQKGSAPGKFNIVSGIARDDAGNYYVADILKSAVLVFDKDLVFRKEFGYRGPKPGNLAAPEDLAAAGNTLFVSNRARRGVSVFQVVAK